MTDDEKLVAPAFRAFDSGVVLGDEAASFAALHAVRLPLAYRQPIIVDDLPAGASAVAAARSAPVSAQTGRTLSADHVSTHLRHGPAALAPIRRVGAARFRNRSVAPAVTVRAPS